MGISIVQDLVGTALNVVDCEVQSLAVGKVYRDHKGPVSGPVPHWLPSVGSLCLRMWRLLRMDFAYDGQHLVTSGEDTRD